MTFLDKHKIIAEAKWKWSYILPSFGIDQKLLRPKNGPCPICGGEDRFSFDDKFGDGNYYCRKHIHHPESGNGFNLLMAHTGWNFYQTLSEVASLLNGSPPSTSSFHSRPTYLPAKVATNDFSKQKKYIHHILEHSLPVTENDPVWRYLANRGLNPHEICFQALRFHPKLLHTHDNVRSHHPAMIGLIHDHNENIISLHRTYITSSGHKASIHPVKKLTCSTVPNLTSSGALIKLRPATSGIVGIAEGIETSLAANELFGIPTWSAINTSILQNAKLPDNIHTVHIFADNDSNSTSNAGFISANKLKDTLVARGKNVTLHLPSSSGDFLDALQHIKGLI